MKRRKTAGDDWRDGHDKRRSQARNPTRGRPARSAMGTQTAMGTRSAGGWWRGSSVGAKIGYATAAIATALAVAACLTAYGVYMHLDSNIHGTAVKGLAHRSVYGVQNILVLGSQTRDGQGPGFGYDPGTNLSDNLLLVHLNATHTRAIVVSIPRDTLVYEPACKARVGKGTVPAMQNAMIDDAMSYGGPSCAVATVKDLTHIPIDHFVEFDFNSFRALIDTVGGVEVCVPPGGYSDPYSKLHISGGRHLITGNEALAFVRTRHGVGDGGDLGRIQLQQEFISSLVQKMESQETLDDPVKLLEIANTATKALTVDTGLDSIPKLLHLADTMKSLHTKDVTFVTMPTIEDPANLNRLLPQQPEDDVLWQMVSSDKQWTGHLPQTPASKTRVAVLNGTGTSGLAGQAARHLRRLGFDVTHVGDAPATSTTTVTYPSGARAGSAWTLMNALKQPPAAQNGVSGPVTLIIGSDFAGVQAPPAPRQQHAKQASKHASSKHGGAQPVSSSSLQSSVQTRNAAASICSAMPAANPDVGPPPP